MCIGGTVGKYPRLCATLTTHSLPIPLPPPVSLARVLSQVARAVAAKFFSDSTSNVGGPDLTNNVQLTQSTPFWCQAIGALLTLYVAV